MEREIIFRGKRIDESEWAEGSLLSINGNCYIYKGSYGDLEDIDFGYGFQIVSNETVGQYTGTKDKNGKRIFEDDVLNCVSDDCEYDYKTKVYPCGNTLCVDIVGQEGDYTSIDFAYDYWDNENCNVEIIGNIYDNPGLL